jgi:predicted secreted protein
MKISTLKSWICRTKEGRQKLTSYYKKLTVSQRLKEKNYSFEADY